MNTDSVKHSLRQTLRTKRKELSDKAQAVASRNLVKPLRHLPQLLRAKRVLSYQPFAGEISPAHIERSLPFAQLYYPRITHYRRRQMRLYPASYLSQTNSLGISEPSTSGAQLPAHHLDAVLLPLVAFDRSGNRLGMGAGFYDRAFAFKRREKVLTRPFLIGVAHHFQEVKLVSSQSWDVPLDAILTDQELIIVR